MSGAFCDRCGYNMFNGDCECPERAGLAAAVLARRVGELEHGRGSAPDAVSQTALEQRLAVAERRLNTQSEMISRIAARLGLPDATEGFSDARSDH